MSYHMIDLQSISKSYGKVEVLTGLSFSVKQGEIYGFLGPNGAGKTTTIGIITGLLRPSSGICKVFGQDINSIKPSFYRKIGVVFEEKNLYHRLSGTQNLKFYANLYRVSGQRITNLLQVFQLAHVADRAVKTYSKGMKQRLLICRALLHDPELLILDEPTSGLDPVSLELIRQAIARFKEKGKTIFLSTHFMEEAEQLCDRVAFINRGRLITVDHPANLKKRYRQDSLHDAFIQLTNE